ncbi:MAG: class E sortase [Microbacteriaceae bacterium]
MTVDASGSPRAGAARGHRRVGVTGVLGEILLSLGVVVLLYVVWQMWVGDWIYGAQNNAAGRELSAQWEQEHSGPDALPIPDLDPDAKPAEGPAVPPVLLPEPADAEIFALMRVPRWGDDYATAIAGGVSRARTLDHIGIGHYPGTQMPGELGNFALAAHRTTWGAPFARIADLRVGDPIVIEAPDGWYTYRFRTLEYVKPDEVDVLLPVPQAPGVEANERYITLTSCSPRFSLAERIVAYGVFEGFQPRADGPPASLAGPDTLAAAPAPALAANGAR